MRIEALLPQATIEAFHFGIVRRLAGTTKVEFDAALIGPFIHDLGNELAAIVDFDNAGQPSLRCNAIERIHDILSFQALAYLDGQTLPRIVVYYGQCAQSPAIEQRICDEIHAPDLIDSGYMML